MNPPKPRLNEPQHAWARDWWRALQPLAEGEAPPQGELARLGRGARAQLRRCRQAGELLVQPAVFALARGLIERSHERLADASPTYERLAWVAAVLACVKNDTQDGRSLAWHLGKAAGGEREAMSERRFKAMLRCTSLPDLCTHWRRAVQLANGTADVARLADDLLAWQFDLTQGKPRASDGIRFHWAFDYYLSAKEQGEAAPSLPADNASTEENHP
ncbi:type I-E CRISPR-associated protein Cse2/CasB [Vandammella animalimorsus]|uniref:type I-E CRISPR-associated protein Cse2/CasB n=1 Tax=Vandammella animalimorsus TaxID=2029117 RepID=UPI00325A6424